MIALLTIMKITGKNPHRCPSLGKWINELWSIHTIKKNTTTNPHNNMDEF